MLNFLILVTSLFILGGPILSASDFNFDTGLALKSDLADKFKEAFAEKYGLKREEIKKGIVDKVYNKEKVEK